jgi:hypothetical protein
MHHLGSEDSDMCRGVGGRTKKTKVVPPRNACLNTRPGGASSTNFVFVMFFLSVLLEFVGPSPSARVCPADLAPNPTPTLPNPVFFDSGRKEARIIAIG